MINLKDKAALKLLKDICTKYDIEYHVFVAREEIRSKRVVKARHEFWYKLSVSGFSAKRIGKILGFCHSSVLYGIKSYIQKYNMPTIEKEIKSKVSNERVVLHKETPPKGQSTKNTGEYEKKKEKLKRRVGEKSIYKEILKKEKERSGLSPRKYQPVIRASENWKDQDAFISVNIGKK